MPNWAVKLFKVVAKTPLIRLFSTSVSTSFKYDTVTKDKDLLKARQKDPLMYKGKLKGIYLSYILDE